MKTNGTVRIPFLLVLVLSLGGLLGPGSRAAETALVLRAARLWDGSTARLVQPARVLLHNGRIEQVGTRVDTPADARVLNLGDVTLLPGLIDAHTHVLLQGDPTLESYAAQILKESIPYRTLRAVRALQLALGYGFTTLRDLGTEGAMYADVDLKKAIDRGIIVGPRLVVATRALSSTGTYPLLGYAWELNLPSGVQVVDGVDAIRRAVREQVAHGADWIKVYVDRNYYIAADGRIRSWRNFTDAELAALVDEAHLRGRKVAAHAIGWDGIDAALRAGVDSIEHGDGLTPDLMDRMVQQDVVWCPTVHVALYVAEPRAREGRPIYKQMIALQRRAFRQALQRGVRIALGTDAGGFPWDENPAQEFVHYVDWGMTPLQALRASTREAARLLGLDHEIGRLAPGYRADIIAVPGNPLRDIRVLLRVRWVIRAGRVYQRPGAASDGAAPAQR